MTYQGFGWKAEGSFLLGSRIITSDGLSFVNQKVAPDLEERQSLLGCARPDGPSPVAPLKHHWATMASQMCSGSCAQALFVLASLAAPMLALSSINRPILVTIGGPALSGKTTAFNMAQAAWGSPGCLTFESLEALESGSKKMDGLPVMIHGLAMRDGGILGRILSESRRTYLILGEAGPNLLSPPDEVSSAYVHLHLKSTKLHSRVPGNVAARSIRKGCGAAGEMVVTNLVNGKNRDDFLKEVKIWSDDFGASDVGQVMCHIAAAATLAKNLGLMEISPQTVRRALTGLMVK